LAMHRFIDGEGRMQPALLPHSLEDYVDEAEMSLLVLAYNIKRMIAIFGVGPLMAAITA
jgi:hypothetical protein